ncbi:uncharacterized protein [Dysidea avara]|uniref:uncharacterized protein isoform X2 n=1 Tax=Dysidea avara TaxID=196820 RepID=UPI003328EF83
MELQRPVAQSIFDTATKREKDLQQKSFPWDTFLVFIASSIVGLSISNVVIDFFRPEQSTVVCFVPTDNHFDRDQVAYVNNFCIEDLPPSVYFPIALFTQGTLLLSSHYGWKVLLSARIDFFFTHVAELESMRDRSTGKYPDKNFDVVEYMYKELNGKSVVVRSYLFKLVFQFAVVILAIVFNAKIFDEFEHKFNCDINNTSEEVSFQNITCVFSKLHFLFFLSIFDYVFLGLSIIFLLWGFGSCIYNHSDLQHKDVAIYCYELCINSQDYMSNSRYYKNDYSAKCKKILQPLRWFTCNDDHNFLLLLLFASNAGLGKVFRSMQIANDISHMFNSHLELPIEKAANYVKSRISDSGNEMNDDDDDGNSNDNENPAPNSQGSTQSDGIKVTSVILDQYYKGLTDVVDYEDAWQLWRIPASLFGLPISNINEFKDKCRVNKVKVEMVVIGPLDGKQKINTVQQILMLDELYKNNCCLIVFQPTFFPKWKPLKKAYSGDNENRRIWKEPEQQDQSNNVNSEVKFPAMCGDTVCQFSVKTYKYTSD